LVAIKAVWDERVFHVTGTREEQFKEKAKTAIVQAAMIPSDQGIPNHGGIKEKNRSRRGGR